MNHGENMCVCDDARQYFKGFHFMKNTLNDNGCVVA